MTRSCPQRPGFINTDRIVPVSVSSIAPVIVLSQFSITIDCKLHVNELTGRRIQHPEGVFVCWQLDILWRCLERASCILWLFPNLLALHTVLPLFLSFATGTAQENRSQNHQLSRYHAPTWGFRGHLSCLVSVKAATGDASAGGRISESYHPVRVERVLSGVRVHRQQNMLRDLQCQDADRPRRVTSHHLGNAERGVYLAAGKLGLA